MKDKYIGQEFQSYFIAENVILKFDINDNLDVIIEISSKMEFELYEELRKTFPEDDIKILKKIAKRRQKLRNSLGPMYTKLGKKSKRKMDRVDDVEFDKMSEDSL